MNQSEIQKIDSLVDGYFSKAKASSAVDICAVWKVARPIIAFASTYLLFWKPKWKAAIHEFAVVVDTLCAGK